MGRAVLYVYGAISYTVGIFIAVRCTTHIAEAWRTFAEGREQKAADKSVAEG